MATITSTPTLTRTRIRLVDEGMGEGMSAPPEVGFR
jgi:hypothetical protein